MARQEHPLVGVNGLLVDTEGTSPALKLGLRYAAAVQRAGGVPVAIPPVGGPRDVSRLVASIDGLLLTGGDDFDMARLGLGPTHPAACPVPGPKQDFDFELARAALAAGLPVLGICYGMQLLALVGGGRMYQHLPDDRPGSQAHAGGVLHPVSAVPGTKLAALLGVEPLQVVSRHHQAVAAVGPAWQSSALDEQGLIEAVECSDHPFALGVQWHPELSPEGSAQDRLFRALVSAAGLSAARSAPRTVLETR